MHASCSLSLTLFSSFRQGYGVGVDPLHRARLRPRLLRSEGVTRKPSAAFAIFTKVRPSATGIRTREKSEDKRAESKQYHCSRILLLRDFAGWPRMCVCVDNPAASLLFACGAEATKELHSEDR